MDVEDMLTQASHGNSDGDDKEDDIDRWVNEQGKLSPSDLKELEEDVQPIRKTLVKVRCQWVIDYHSGSRSTSHKLLM